MLIRTGGARTETLDLSLAALLSTIAGALNAVGFLVAGTFTANMTGNLSAMADTLVVGQVALALSFAGLVLAFITGAVCAGIAVHRGERRGHRAIYAWVICAQALMLLALGAMQLRGGMDQAHLVVSLSFLMGLQNAVTTMISKARVRTTHVSGMVTDLGIELSAMTIAGETRREALPKLKLHALSLLCFALGGIGGTLFYGVVGGWLFIVAAAVLLALALSEIWLARRG
ncbi:MAG: YoaK family protein [Pseudomonadota bacterium]|nr:YoaK family protein [Pseudomonadota bacterium]